MRVTNVKCDRCGSLINVEHSHSSGAKSRTGPEPAATITISPSIQKELKLSDGMHMLDLCLICKGKFVTFMKEVPQA